MESNIPGPDPGQEPPPPGAPGSHPGSHCPAAAVLAIGTLIRDLRSAAGWSQSRLAGELHAVSGRDTVTRELISRWENGGRAPGPFWLRHLAAALQVPLSLLEEAERMERRVFLTDIAGAAVAPLVASDLISHGFASALGSRPSQETWDGRVAAYGRDYMTLGAAEIRQRLAGDLVILQQQLETPRMWAVAARLMTLYAKTFPGADGGKASGWYRMAAAAADRSGDPGTRVWVRGRAAIALGYEGASLGLADLFAGQAAAAGGGPSLGLLNAVMGRAHAAAIRGDRAGALALLAEGRRVFDAAGSGDGEQSDYAVPWWRMNVYVSLLAARLGDERLAGQAADAAAAALPQSLPRFATHLELHRGLLLARAGDRAGGIAHARAAMDALPPERHSLTLRMLMEEIAGPA
ncbi:MAG TPA: helix-turn-helix transcriptional regulator [Streptosporangiaceae bacterium]|nr:helix-turn-helix transcriptional regulator [Streptosporangiaceae bacterium]